MITYLFYDIETSGLNKCFDQVIQFAGIRTNLNFDELERYEIWIKLNPDIIPSPEAIIINKFTIEDMLKGNCEYNAIRKIHDLFNTPETITIGYNNMGFDDEFIRFSFYRNLLDPYTHQFANNCRRMDLFPIITMYKLYDSNIINWPKINGISTLKLEYLSIYNNLITENSFHNALSDVKATIALAKILKKNRKMWDYISNCFIKNNELEKLKILEKKNVFNEYKFGLLIDGNFGNNKYYQIPVIFLGWHKYYKNQSIWFPLDSICLSKKTNIEDITKNISIYRKRFGENPFLLPWTKFFIQHLKSDRLQVIFNNLSWLNKNKSFLNDLSFHYRNLKYSYIKNLDIDASLYQKGFMNIKQVSQCNYFHKIDPESKIHYLDEIDDLQLKEQMIRILGRNYHQILSQNKKYFLNFKTYLTLFKKNNLIMDYKNQPKLNTINALKKIKDIFQTHNVNEKQREILISLFKYIQSL